MEEKPVVPAKPKRIALFTPTLYYGGVERVVVNLARGFLGIGYAVDIVAANASGEFGEFVPPEARVVSLRARRVISSLPALVRYLRRERPQVVIAAMTHCSIMALWARKLARIDTQVVATEHVVMTSSVAHDRRTRAQMMPLLARLSYGGADAIVAVSAGVADDVAAQTGTPRDRIQVIYNPVVTPELLSNADAPATHPWFEAAQPPVVVSVGRLEVQKGYPMLIRAFSRVRATRPARLLILGEGSQRAELEALVRELGVQEDVHLPGYEGNPYAYMAHAAVYVLSSISEGMGVVIVEAMALGAPVVATDCRGGPRELLQDGRLGKLVPVGDADALAAAIQATLDNPPPRVPREELERYEIPWVARAYASLFRE